MKKLFVVVASLVAFLGAAFMLTSLLASRAEQESDVALSRFASSGPRADGHGPSDRNALALELETLADPLGIQLRPNEPGGKTTVDSKLPEALVRSMRDWLRVQEEKTTDTIDPLPSDVSEWLHAHRAGIDAIAGALVEKGTPRWPDKDTGPASERPIPNLLGHMHLFRVLQVASLDREAQGDHLGAWRLQQAAWHLARGLFDRSEVISALIGVAGVRMGAAAQRKLETPVPAWVAEMSQRRMHHEMLEGIRSETALTSKIVREGGWLEELGAGLQREPNKAMVLSEAVSSPFIRWAVAENTAVAMDALATIRDLDPCAATTRRLDREIEQEVNPLARRFGGLVLPNLTSAITRAALADMAVEGTAKILAVKTARAASPEHAWPAAVPGVDASRCDGARWVYSVDETGAMSLRFDGEVRTPADFPGSKIPFEYSAPATPVS